MVNECESPQASCFCRLKGLVERSRLVSTEVIENHFDELLLGVTFINQPFHLLCKVELSMVFSHRDMPPPSLRLDKDEEVADSIALILVIIALSLAWLSRQGEASFFDELFT